MNEHPDLLVNTGPCRVCNDPSSRAVEMPVRAYIDWMDGTPLGEAWPDATPRQYRMLVTGACLHHQMDETSRT